MVLESVLLADLKKEVALGHVEPVVAAVEIEVAKEEEEDWYSVSEVVEGSAGEYTQRTEVVRKVEYSLE